MRAHLRDVYSYSYYRVGNHHDAEDLTEQAFLQAYRHFERARRESDGRPMRPWLIRIAHNLASNYHRDRSRRPVSNIEAAEPAHPHSTERVVEGREELRLVIRKLDGLPEDRREALIMRFALGMSNREIARALGRTDGATKVLIHRALAAEEQMAAETRRARRKPMSEAAGRMDLEALLADALRPIDPPESLSSRVETTLSAITEQAAQALGSRRALGGELEALRDPRNGSARWPRSRLAAAAGALVVVGARRRRKPTGLRAQAERIIGDIGTELRR